MFTMSSCFLKNMIWVSGPVKIISLILSWVVRWVGRKREIPEKKKKKHLTIRKQNMACLTCDPSKARTHSGEMSDLER